MSQHQYHFWNGQQVISVADTGQHHTELAHHYHLMPCFAPHYSSRIRRYSYLGWRELPQSLVPKQLLVLKLILGGTPTP